MENALYKFSIIIIIIIIIIINYSLQIMNLHDNQHLVALMSQRSGFKSLHKNHIILSLVSNSVAGSVSVHLKEQI